MAIGTVPAEPTSMRADSTATAVEQVADLLDATAEVIRDEEVPRH